ncbi:MAG: SAM-dependent chlorinase/fluorinase [Nitrospinae bacterium]|nr:SAM-dependent chlorinase/fluorinase [Nitrospinota bacterium]
MKQNNIITLTTDFGLSDPFVGIMKGVMLGINPSVKFIDISHLIEPQNIIEAYYTLKFSYKYFPSGTIHMAVVDPGVGSERRPILIESKDYFFIGPDNGIFSFVFENEPSANIIELTEKKFFLPPISQTFHGRDIFASVAGWLSSDVKPYEFGIPINNPVILKLPEPAIEKGKISGEVIHIDRFGNLITNISETQFHSFISERDGKVRIKIKNFIIPSICKSYSDDVGPKPSSIFNSWGLLEIFVRNGDAGKKLKIKKGEKVLIGL